MKITAPFLNTELLFTTSRSSGKGGQHTNKVESRVSLFFNVKNSNLLSEEQKHTILNSTHYNGTKDGQLQIDVEKYRSQLKNKQESINRFYTTIEKLLWVERERKTSKPTQASIKKRLKNKQILSEKKRNRKKPM